MTSQDHMECKLAHHGVAHVNKAVGSLFQQQGATQVRVLPSDETKQITRTGQWVSDTHSPATTQTITRLRPHLGGWSDAPPYKAGRRDSHHPRAADTSAAAVRLSGQHSCSEECFQHLGEHMHLENEGTSEGERSSNLSLAAAATNGSL